jgi:outer membrane protein
VLKNRQNAKIVSLVIVAAFIIGILGVGLTQFSNIQAAPSSNIGKVDYNRLVNEHPQMANFRATMQKEVEQAQKDFNTKSANMNDKEKQDYYNQIQERLIVKENQLQAPILTSIDDEKKKVADAKGVNVVFDSRSIVYGGTDLTDDVLKNMK